MEFILAILYLTFFIRTVRNLAYHLAWWWIKEYRIDRMLVHVRETSQGRRWMFGPFSTLKTFLIIIFLLVPGRLTIMNVDGFTLAVTALYSYETIRNFIELRRRWKIPPVTVRSMSLVIISSVTLIFIFLSVPIDSVAFSLLLTDKTLGFVVVGWVFISNRIFNLHKRRVIEEARRKISRYPGLRVIAVTGSYGKTTTKEIIAQLLSAKHRVAKSFGTKNTDIGIAERILQSNLNSIDYFVCEVGAYHPGEIKSALSIFGDKIHRAVITGINEQHQSLFGSLETTMRVKYEVVQSMNKDGTAVFNGESSHMKQVITWAKNDKKRALVVMSGDTRLPRHIHASHFRQNLALASSMAKSCGLKEAEMKNALKTLALPPKTMHETSSRGVTSIDDTFNANPEAVYAALDYLKQKKGVKILVLQPLIELGKYADEIHEKIGSRAAEVCDYIILTNENWHKPFMRGVSKAKKTKAKIQFAGRLPHLEQGTILFEGKEAEKYLPDFVL